MFSFCSVIKGYGQYDITHPAENYVIPPPNNCPYLLLDVRDLDEFQRCSIITGLLLLVYYWITTGILQEYYWNITGILLDYYWITSGLLVV